VVVLGGRCDRDFSTKELCRWRKRYCLDLSICAFDADACVSDGSNRSHHMVHALVIVCRGSEEAESENHQEESCEF
jgi:hypothetical protein